MEAATAREVQLPQGTIRYRESGKGKPLVFVHGLLVDGRLWRKVTPLLQGDFRCIVPDLPLGSHRVPMEPDADLSPPGLARIVDEFMAALNLEDVTLIGNDTGGAIAQITAANHPERIGRLVLTNCDAFEKFLPPELKPLQLVAKVPGLPVVLAQPTRLAAVRRSPLAFGWLIKGAKDDELLADWLGPLLSDRPIRADATKVLRGINKRHTLEAAERLRSFDRPTLLVWAREDRIFKPGFAERLAEAIPGSRLEWVDDSYTFISEDQPQRLAEAIRSFVRDPAPAAAG